jgi:hypothetical protein
MLWDEQVIDIAVTDGDTVLLGEERRTVSR